jgi:hypothetical protein
MSCMIVVAGQVVRVTESVDAVRGQLANAASAVNGDTLPRATAGATTEYLNFSGQAGRYIVTFTSADGLTHDFDNYASTPATAGTVRVDAGLISAVYP